jgi:hypothetical protein
MSKKYLEISKIDEKSQRTNVEGFHWIDSHFFNFIRHSYKNVLDKNIEQNTSEVNFLSHFKSEADRAYLLFDNSYEIDKDLKNKQPSKVETELSEYVITSEGVVNEHWTSVLSLPSQIIEVNDSFVLMECLLDYEKQILEKRKFKRNLVEGKCKMALYSIVILKISEKPGKLQFEFQDGMNLGYEKYFTESNYILDIDSLDTGKFIK